ncbi:DegT/DnrJ/EryC1/StrS family aminotransferase [bacterium]|nr:DegT/DnrJ/EryC1/StrS family aminotransferase [bacterium]
MSQPNIVPPLDLKEQIVSLRPALDKAMDRIISTGAFVLGAEVASFEDEIADYLGVEHAVGLNSGTDALVIALRALDVGPGDEVITTPFTFFASAEAICLVGATPVFADIDETTFNICPQAVSNALTPKTKALMPVHLYGRVCNHEELVLASDGLPIVEDACQAFGASWKGTKAGALGAVGSFSFYPTKNLSAFGDGGLLSTNDPNLAQKARMLRQHGEQSRYNNEILGYNSRLDALQAAVLRVKLPHIDKWNDARRTAASRYEKLLTDTPGIILPEIPDGHIVHQYTVRLPGADRDAIQARMREAGVITMVYYPIPAHRLPVFGDRFPSCPVAERLAGEVLSLPVWPEIAPAQQERVVSTLLSALKA